MRIASILLAAGILFGGTTVIAQQVSYDYDRSADFGRYRTYTWVRGTELADRLNHARVVAAIEAQLAAKGLARVDGAASADVLVAYHASFDRDIQVTGFSSGWGPYRFGPGGTGIARAEEILTGTLVVDVVDRATRTIVWRGTASKEIDVTADPDKRDRNINRAAARLFKSYPPAR